MQKTDVAATLSIFMRSLSDDVITENDPGEIIGEKDRELITKKVLEQLGIEVRARLYVETMTMEITELAKRITDKMLQDKIKKASRPGII